MSTQCSIALLESALAGNLPADDETALHCHLEECEQCSAALERMAGGAAWCQEAAALLAKDEMDAALPGYPFAGGDEWSEVDFTVEHLEAADEPNILGRLGGYDVLEIIGRGGMGVVLKAFDRELKRCVAIKVLAPHLAQSPLARKRFTREARAAAAVVHPNVLAIHQVQPNGRLPFLVMPLVAGESLAQRLTDQGRLELKEVLRVGMQVAAGLAAAHEQGLVHRDVKPANILLEKGIERAVITDFGLARAADDVTLTRWGVIAGTPQYMSPEQTRGEALDGRSDLFSLGCVLYEMATGVSPFRADSLMATMRRLVDDSPQAMASLNSELPPWFIAIVDRLLEKAPSRRFGSAKEVSELLEGCLAHVQQPASAPLPAAFPKQGIQPNRRRRRFRGLLLPAIAMTGIVLFGAMLMKATDPPDISGEWSGEYWGHVALKKTNDAEYTGSYSDTDTKHLGEIQVRWSRIERQFTGTWREGDFRFGDISVCPVGNELRVAIEVDAQCKINPGTPHLKGMTWTRAETVATDDHGGRSEAGAPQNVSAAVEKAVTTISTCLEGDPRLAEAMALLKGLNETDVVKELVRFLDSQVATIRRAALYILWQGKFSSIASAVPGLLRLCEDQEDFTRGMSALALGGNRIQSSLAVLMKMTSEDQSGYARRCAAIALGFLGNPAATEVLEKALKDPEPLVRANAQAALTMLRGTAAENAPSKTTFSPTIERVTVNGNKVVIEGKAPADARISFYAGNRNNGWGCGFPKATRFAATLEMGSQGLSCRVVPETGNPVLTLGGVKQIGTVVLSDGQFIFRAGQPHVGPDGTCNVTIGEWDAKSGEKTAVGVSLSPPHPSAVGAVPTKDAGAQSSQSPAFVSRTFPLRFKLASAMADDLRQILLGRPGHEAKPSASNQEITITAPPEVMKRVPTFITVTDWPDNISRRSNFEYPRETVMRAARSFFYACAIEDTEEAFSKLLSLHVLAELKGDTKSKNYFDYSMGQAPDPEWERSLRADWPGKKEAIQRLVREWNRYPLKRITEESGIAIGFGVKHFCTVSLDGAPKDFYTVEIEPGRTDRGTGENSYFFSSLPPWWSFGDKKDDNPSSNLLPLKLKAAEDGSDRTLSASPSRR
ncbi:MAG: protein kinase domain-containing protein [Thermoguttaceae bacterium]